MKKSYLYIILKRKNKFLNIVIKEFQCCRRSENITDRAPWKTRRNTEIERKKYSRQGRRKKNAGKIFSREEKLVRKV